MRHLLFGSFFFLLASCSQPIKLIIVDNPTDESITFQFGDGETFTIDANKKETFEVPFGKSTVIINGSETHEIDLDAEREYVLNPSLEDYYLQKIIYFMSARAEKKYIEDYGEIKSEIDGREVNGDFTKIDGKLAIPKNWTYGLDEEPKEQATVKFAGGKTHVSTNKLHRQKDLLAVIDLQLQQSFQKLLDEIEAKKD
ncbi:MAG: hypothetical protein HKN51_01055 [Saprospiraceae bacterium]|nr:hypothetical protein [Saprospiraceae bacterium]